MDFIRKYLYLKSLGCNTYYAAKIAQWTVESNSIPAVNYGYYIDEQLRAYPKN